MAEVCVTIVLHNSEQHLAACLGALRDEDVVLVDNASPDDSVAIAQQALPGAQLIRSPRNVGFAGGCNLAWPHVSARYWLLLNPDVVLDDGAVPALAAWMDAHPDVGVASPWLDGVSPGRAFPSAWVALAELLRLERLARRAPRPGWVPGTAMIVRSEAVRDAGPLDEAFFLYGEDIEWCWRMRRAGWRVAVSDAGGGRHHASASSRRTWDDATVQGRIAAGILQACARIRSRKHARAFGLVTALAMSIEARHPRRTASQRRDAATLARAYRTATRQL